MLRRLHFILFALLLGSCGGQEQARRWVGSDYFAMPLHDWTREGDSFLARPASFAGRWRDYKSRLYHATQDVGASGEFATTFHVRHRGSPESKNRRGGIWLGLKSATPSPQNVWIHPAKKPLFIGISPHGKFQVGDATMPKLVDQNTGVKVVILGSIGSQEDHLKVTAISTGGEIQKLELTLPAGSLSGAISLMAQGKDSVWVFKDWKIEGDALVQHTDRTVGPILWTQYTLQDNGYLKLQAQMVPLETTDSQTAKLEFKQGEEWKSMTTANLEPVSSTFLFRVPQTLSEESIPYRVVYAGPDGDHAWEGVIRANPKKQNTFKLGVFNCDHGDLFPQDTMVSNVVLQDPDMLFFAGDQIYEDMDKVQVVREPAEGARLSYLSKYYQFGLTWRELLKDRPSVIIPDDHDVFMPNVWGNNGLGYSMPPDWVNMIQRTQVGSLPDPVDPAPVERGIEVYFTALDYAGMSFAVIEDRKFKTPENVTHGIKTHEPEPMTELDVPGAKLLGARQLSFLDDWSHRTQELPVRWFLSQSMLAKPNTHTAKDFKRFYRDLDANGWPQSARNRALRTLPRETIMVHGDQHLGMLARLGIDTWDDGPLAFMVTGSAVGFPRAWWPEQPAADGSINGPHTGRFLDDMGNHITVLGVTNPEPLPGGVGNAVVRPDYQNQGMFQLQNAKGAGYGLVTVDKAKREATFAAYRLDSDAAAPGPNDQYPGFPITIPLR